MPDSQITSGLTEPNPSGHAGAGGIFPTLNFRLIAHYLGMEANSVALAGYGFIALAGAMSVLRWRSRRRFIAKLPKPNESDGHQRAAEREEAWYKEALAACAYRK